MVINEKDVLSQHTYAAFHNKLKKSWKCNLRPRGLWTANSDKKYMELNGAAFDHGISGLILVIRNTWSQMEQH